MSDWRSYQATLTKLDAKRSRSASVEVLLVAVGLVVFGLIVRWWWVR